jgi:hypothetical protein
MQKFVEYIKKKEDFYEEGGDVTYEELMDWALNKFRARVENEQWCQRTTEEETIIALQAQTKKLISSARADKKKGEKKANPRESPRVRSRLLIGKEAPPRGGRRLHPRKVNQPPNMRLERSGIGAPTTRHGPSTRNRNAKELTSSQATIVPRKSRSQRTRTRRR